MPRRDLDFAGLDETWLLITTAISAITAVVQGRGERELEGFRRTVAALLEERNRKTLEDRLADLQVEVERQRILPPAADARMDWRMVEYEIVLQEAARGKLLKFERVRVQ